MQAATEDELDDEEEEAGDWDTEWVNDEAGSSQAVEWFVEDEDENPADQVS